MTTQPVSREASASRPSRLPWFRIAAGFLHGVVAVNCALWAAAALQGLDARAPGAAPAPVVGLGALGALVCIRASLDAFRIERPMTPIVQDVAWTAAVTAAGFYVMIALRLWALP